jgi:hypothetical protein
LAISVIETGGKYTAGVNNTGCHIFPEFTFNTVTPLSALQRQNTEISKQILPEKEYRGLSPNFHIHVSV